MRKKENSNIMIKILSKILIIIIALFVLLIISVGLNIYFAYELSTYETVVTVTYKNEWETEKDSDDNITASKDKFNNISEFPLLYCYKSS